MSKRKAVLVMPAHGRPEVLAIREFKELYGLVQCELLQLVQLDSELVLWVDEEGLLKGAPRANRMASMLAGIPIVGNAVLTRFNMQAEDEDDEVVGLTDSFLQAYRDLLNWSHK